MPRFLLLLLPLLLATAVAGTAKGSGGTSPTSCSIVAIGVDHHYGEQRPALDVALAPLVGWQLAPGCGVQRTYHIVVEQQLPPPAAPRTVWDSGVVASNTSSNVRCGAPLRGGWLHRVTVTATFSSTNTSTNTSITTSTASKAFLTLLEPQMLGASPPVWLAGSPSTSTSTSSPTTTPTVPTPEYVLLRRTLPAPAQTSSSPHTYLTIAAAPTPDLLFPHGINSSHLLCGYKAWLNGVPLGVGPGRKVGGSINADTYNLTAMLQAGPPVGSVLAIEAYGIREAERGVLVLLHDGAGRVAPAAAAAWAAYNATAAFNPSPGPDNAGEGCSRNYYMPLENLRSDLYPHGWRLGRDGSRGWAPAAARAAWTEGVQAKQARPVVLRPLQAAAILTLGPGHYIVDFGRNFQGGVNATFGPTSTAHQLTVRMGEQLNVTAQGVVQGVIPLACVGHRFEVVWTLAAASSPVSFVPHEYLEFRYVELINAPEPPTLASFRGWAVRYPFEDEDVEPTRDDRAAAGGGSGTQFASSSAALNAVWALVQWTVRAAAIDLNTDSNTRQRDVCTLDAFLTTLYQSGTYPSSSFHHRRRVTQFMYEPLGYVNFWTEFLTSTLGALYHLTYDSADSALAGAVWENQPNGLSLAHNFSLTAFFDPARSLVVHTPKPLVDWPRSSAIDVGDQQTRYCNELCVQMNAHAVTAQQQAAVLAGWLGKDDEARAYASRAAAIRQAARTAFAADPAQCDPPGAGPCFTDMPAGAASRPSTAQASGMAVDAGLAGSANASLALVPFLRARNARRGVSHGLELSGWQAFFMLRGVYTAAGAVDEGPVDLRMAADGAAFGWEVLTATGTNSWLGGMIGAMNATMTCESWITDNGPLPSEGGSTLSHPWTAAPAAIIPRYLMGIRPLAAGWQQIAVHPLPPPALQTASIVVPTPRGAVSLAFVQQMHAAAGWSWSANITVPGNTPAHICAPRYLAAPGASCTGELARRGEGLAAADLVRRGALLCLQDMVVGGELSLNVQCV